MTHTTHTTSLNTFITATIVTSAVLMLMSCSSDSGSPQSDTTISTTSTTESQLTQESASVTSHQHNSAAADLDVDDNDSSVSDTLLAQDGFEGLVAYDESIPESVVNAYWILPETIEDLTFSSEIVFTGRVTGYVETVQTAVLSAESRFNSDIYARVFDGVVFTVEELIKGELPDDTGQVTIKTWALKVDEEGQPLFRVSFSPIEKVREGIEKRNLPDGPRYLVFGNQRPPGTPYYDPGLYTFNTPSGVAELYDDGTIAEAASKPLSGITVIENEDGSLTGKRHVFTVEEIRTVAQLVTEDNNNPDTLPDDLLPTNPGTELEENSEIEPEENLGIEDIEPETTTTTTTTTIQPPDSTTTTTTTTIQPPPTTTTTTIQLPDPVTIQPPTTTTTIQLPDSTTTTTTIPLSVVTPIQVPTEENS